MKHSGHNHRSATRATSATLAAVLALALLFGAGTAPVGAAQSAARVACPGGGTITVAPSVADEVRHLLSHARADGLMLCGSGLRSAAAQIGLRRANCGTSHQAIWHAAADRCSPPTALPGTSMHETGLAVDFHSCRSGSRCFNWLRRHAAAFGLRNLPSEPWHWSTNGR